MGKVMSHRALKFFGRGLDKIDACGTVGMEIDKTGSEGESIQLQPRAAGPPGHLSRLGTYSDNPAGADKHPGPSEILSAAEHAGSAKKTGFLFWFGFTSSHDWRKITEYRGLLPSAFFAQGAGTQPMCLKRLMAGPAIPVSLRCCCQLEARPCGS